MKTILSILIVSIIFIGCGEQITESPDANELTSLYKKPPKPPNPNPTPEPVISLSINDVVLITENDQTNVDGLIILNEDNNKINLKAISAANDPITLVSLEMRYDANIDYRIKSNTEFGGYIIDETISDGSTTFEVTDYPWDLTLMPIAPNDPTYSGKFKVSDQLATPVSDLIPDGHPNADHFYFRVYAITANSGKVVSSWNWVDNKLPPKKTFHIEALCYRGNIAINNRVSQLYWEVLVKDQDGNLLENAEVYHWSDAIPEEYSLGRALCEPSDINGWAIIANGGFTKRDFPYTIYIEGVQWYSGANEAMSVYDPSLNELGWYPTNTVNSLDDPPDYCNHDDHRLNL